LHAELTRQNPLQLNLTLAIKETIMLYRISLLIFVGVFLTPVSAADEQAESGHEKIVRNYVEAFNAHNVEAMLNMVTDDAQ